MENTDLHTKEASKVTKNKDYRTIRIPVNGSVEEATRWAEMAAEAGFRPKLQKLVTERKDTGKATICIKGIAKWLREAVIPEYEAHAWEREQKRAEALRKREEANAELKRLGVKSV